MKKRWVVLYLLLFLTSVVLAQEIDYVCIYCMPTESITLSTIDDVRTSPILEARTVDIAFNHDNDELYIINNPRLRSTSNNAEATQIASLPNYILIAELFMFDDSHRGAWDYSGNIDTELGSEATNPISQVVAHPQLPYQAYADSSGNIKIWNSDKEHVLQTIEATGVAITNIAFHPSEAWLAYVVDSSTIIIYDFEQDETKEFELPTDVGQLSNMAFKSDGSLLAVGTDEHILLLDTDTGEILTHEIVDRVIQKVVFYPQFDDIFVSMTTSGISRWQWDEGSLTQDLTFEFLDNINELTDAVFSPDGSLLIAIYDESVVAVWNTATGEQVEIPAITRLLTPSRTLTSLAFTSDGYWLLIGTHRGLKFFVVP